MKFIQQLKNLYENVFTSQAKQINSSLIYYQQIIISISQIMKSKPIFIKRDPIKKGSGQTTFKRKIQSLPFQLTTEDKITKIQINDLPKDKEESKQIQLHFSKSFLVSNRLHSKNNLSSRKKQVNSKQKNPHKSLPPFLKMDNIIREVPKIVHSNSVDRQIKKSKLQINKKPYLLSSLSHRHHSAQTQSLEKIDKMRKQKNQTVQKKEKMSIRYGVRTRQGKVVTNPDKPNQDSYLIKKLPESQSYLFVVADGHGTQGHCVSQLVVNRIQKYYMQKSAKIKNSDIMFTDVCDKIQRELFQTDQINAFNSGSTLISVFIDNNFKLTCANVGDSRAILARQINKKNWEIIHLSEDHKPNLEKERRRIFRKGGSIHAYINHQGKTIGPQRVWLPNQNIQGLAMSRSMGDNISKPIGVTHQPQLTHVQLQARDHFIVIASDGVWEFITNIEVLQLVLPFYKQNKLQQCCDALLKLAYQRWTVEDDTVIDDITFILIFIDQK